MEYKFNIRSKYTYQQYERTQITTTIRKDLRGKLKEYSVNNGQPETKIFDCLLLELFKDKKSMDALIEKVKKYY